MKTHTPHDEDFYNGRQTPLRGHPDEFDRAIEYLMRPENQNDGEIDAAWYDAGGDGHPAGCLFRFIGKGGDGTGCLTMIRHNLSYKATTPELTEEIRRDDRIPMSAGLEKLRGEDLRTALEVFAEYQRRDDVRACQGLPPIVR